VHLD